MPPEIAVLFLIQAACLYPALRWVAKLESAKALKITLHCHILAGLTLLLAVPLLLAFLLTTRATNLIVQFAGAGCYFLAILNITGIPAIFLDIAFAELCLKITDKKIYLTIALASLAGAIIFRLLPVGQVFNTEI